MQQMNNTNTTAGKTAEHAYKFSDTTAALLDCIKATNALYSQIADALELRYGQNGVDDAAAAYLAATEEITELLHREITGQIIDGLSSVSNSEAQTTII